VNTAKLGRGSRPNIVMLFVDDWSKSFWPFDQKGLPRNTGYTQESFKELLPSIRKVFVEDGMELDRHYSHSTCAPSRKSLMSGRFALHVGDANMACEPLPTRISTIGNALQDAGYSTHFIGKWHLGLTSVSLQPCFRGFDTCLGFYHQAVSSQYAWTAHGESVDPDSVYDLFINDTLVDRDHPFLRDGRNYRMSGDRDGTERYAHFTSDVFKRELLRVIDSVEPRKNPLFALLSFAAVIKRH
jgi:arylsulfatase A-like enzyme